MMNQRAENNGPIAAAMLAAGIGCFVFGIIVDLSETIKAIEGVLSFSAGVGALSGKSIVAIVIWLVSWAILAGKWKDQSVDFGKIYNVTLVLIILGIVATFPLFFDLL